MRFNISKQKVGPIELGMSFDLALSKLNEIPGLLEEQSKVVARGMFMHYESELSLSVACQDGRHVNSIEVYRPERDVNFFLESFSVFETPADQLIEALSGEFSVEIFDDGHMFLIRDFLISFARNATPEGNSDDGKFFDSFLVAKPDYYEHLT
ncbi:hypothetical protein [Nocardiopsis alba]|uniref:hypothetical protein n=1 Tax=Nocardiopsis alba TaxID=53437 RepID=UPI0035DD8903